ncbi:MAG: glycoside hydrolase family protein [Paludibacteraceae bacterium]|nr:glycoside hydrolase family protein [Paludibacteraceae bacterium]
MKYFSSLLLAVIACAAIACKPINGPTDDNGGNAQPQEVANQMHKSPKRGVAFSFTNLMDLPLLTDAISWNYNWGNTPTNDAADWFDANGVEYCPMCWNGNYSKDKIRAYVAAHPSTKYLLAFNEPNLTDQANMVPSKAAELWPDVVALAKELNLKLVSPAMNYGTLNGYFDPIKWMDEFLAQPGVSIDDIDAISLHCYMGSAAGLIGFVDSFRKYNKPIWMTEFCAWENLSSVEGQMTYMCQVLNYFEQEPVVERYAWFIPRYKKPGDYPYMQLLTNGSSPELTELGQMFTHFSTFDKSVYLNASKYVYGGEYVALSSNSIQVRPCTDTEMVKQAGKQGLLISNLSSGLSATYQVAVPENASQLVIRYSGYSESIFEVLVDGKSYNFADAPRTGSDKTFAEAIVPVSNLKGNHTITISLVDGSCYLSGFYMK